MRVNWQRLTSGGGITDYARHPGTRKTSRSIICSAGSAGVPSGRGRSKCKRPDLGTVICCGDKGSNTQGGANEKHQASRILIIMSKAEFLSLIQLEEFGLRVPVAF